MNPALAPTLRRVAVATAVAATVAVLAPTGGASAASRPLNPNGTWGGVFPTDTSTTVDRLPVPATPALSDAAGTIDPLGAHGFGVATTGGAGGRTVVVSSAADDPVAPAPGTLRWATRLPGAKWIVFDRDLTIRLRAALPVTSDTTIDGRGHAIGLTGHGISGLTLTGVQNVIIENLTLRDFGDIAKTAQNDPYDAITVTRSSRVWIDHNTLSMAGDKLIGVADGSEQLTISWNHFYDQEQTLQLGSMSNAVRDTAMTATVDHNYFDHVGYRTPVVSYGKAHVYNNVMAGWTAYAVRSERLAQVLLEGNLFQAGANKQASLVAPGQVCNDRGSLCDARSGYLTNRDNLYVGKVKTAETGTGHVFVPSRAYDYVAEKASLAMGATVTRLAGATPVATVGPPSAARPVPPKAAPRPQPRVTASLRVRNAWNGADVLAVGTHRPAHSRPVVSMWRASGRHWVRVRAVRLPTAGAVRLVVPDHRRHRLAAYRATMTVSGQHVRSNLARLR